MKNYIVTFIYIISCMSCTSSISPIELICMYNHDAVYYYLPIKVNGQELTFLIDTGAQCTSIDYVVAQKMGIVPIDSSFHTIRRTTYIHQDSTFWGLVNLQIGAAKIENKIKIDRYKKTPISSMSIYDNCDGILGVDVIGQFNWLFDFKNKIVCLSDKEIDNPLMSEKPALSLEIARSKKEVTYVRLLINNTLEKNFLFDTGFLNGIKIGDYNLHGSFCFSDTLSTFLAKRFPNNLTINTTDTTSVLLMEQLQVNEMKFSNISATYHNKLLFPNIITAQFLSRFRFMYYDKIEKKIDFYLPQSNTNEEEIQLLCTKIKNMTLNNKGDGMNIPWSDVFTKHDSAIVVKPVTKK